MQNPVLEIIQYITNSRKKFGQGQVLSWDERVTLVAFLRDSLRDEAEKWISEEASETHFSPAFVARWSVGAALAICENNLLHLPPSESLRPLGVISIINPFGLGFRNAFARLVPALLAGNRMILKMSSKDAAVGRFLSLLIAREPKLADVLHVTFAPSAEVGELLVSHPGLQGVSFWGAHSRVEKIFSGMRLSCHRQWSMGGTSVVLVLDEEGLEKGFSSILSSVVEGMGTLPWNPTRVIVIDALEDALLARIGAVVGSLRAELPAKMDLVELESRIAKLRTQEGELLGSGPGIRFVKGFSLCSELRFEGGGYPIVFVDTIKYAHEANKKISAMERVWSLQVWGAAEKAYRIGSKLEIPIVAVNKGLLEMDPLLWNADPSVSGGCQDLRFDGAFFSRHQTIDGAG